MIMAVASPQVELLISLFFSEDDVNFSYVSYISTSGITTLHTQDIFLEKIKNHANNLIGDHRPNCWHLRYSYRIKIAFQNVSIFTPHSYYFDR